MCVCVRARMMLIEICQLILIVQILSSAGHKTKLWELTLFLEKKNGVMGLGKYIIIMVYKIQSKASLQLKTYTTQISFTEQRKGKKKKKKTLFKSMSQFRILQDKINIAVEKI